MRRSKQYMTKGIELPKQKKILMLREKVTYKLLGILESDSIKQVEMKEQIKKSISGEQKKNSNPNYFEKNLIKGLNDWVVPSCEILGTIFQLAE